MAYQPRLEHADPTLKMTLGVYSPLRVSVDGFWYFVPHRLHAQQRTPSGLDLRHLLHSAGGSAGTRLIARLLRGDTVGQAKIVSELR